MRLCCELMWAPCRAVVGSGRGRAWKGLSTTPGTLSIPESLPLVPNTVVISSGTSKKGIPGMGLAPRRRPQLRVHGSQPCQLCNWIPYSPPPNSAKHPGSPLPIDRGHLRPKRKHGALMAESACRREQAPPSHGPTGVTGEHCSWWASGEHCRPPY